MSWLYQPESEPELKKFKPRNGRLTDFLEMFIYSLQVEKLKVSIEKKQEPVLAIDFIIKKLKNRNAVKK